MFKKGLKSQKRVELTRKSVERGWKIRISLQKIINFKFEIYPISDTRPAFWSGYRITVLRTNFIYYSICVHCVITLSSKIWTQSIQTRSKYHIKNLHYFVGSQNILLRLILKRLIHSDQTLIFERIFYYSNINRIYSKVINCSNRNKIFERIF